jgi:hypothetical protein
MIAFWRGTPSVADSVPWSASAWITSSSGGSPTRIAAGLTVAKMPMWLPDGKHLIVVGYDSDKAFQSANITGGWSAQCRTSSSGFRCGRLLVKLA